jgi:hypothetical protein
MASLTDAEKAQVKDAVLDAIKPISAEITKLLLSFQRSKVLSLCAGLPGATAETTIVNAKKMMQYLTSELADADHKEGDTISTTFYGLNAQRAGTPDNGTSAFTVEYSDNKVVITKGNDAPFGAIFPGQWESVGVSMRKRFWGG